MARKRLFVYISILFLVIVAGAFYYLYLNRSTTSKPEYVHGEIIVGFKPGVSESDGLEIIKSWGLSIKSLPISFKFTDFIIRASGDGDKAEEKLKQSGLFALIDRFGQGSMQQMAASPKESTAESDVEAFIKKNPELTLVSVRKIDLGLAIGVLVPDGSENEWIAKFQKVESVDYAELNFIGHGFTDAGF